MPIRIRLFPPLFFDGADTDPDPTINFYICWKISNFSDTFHRSASLHQHHSVIICNILDSLLKFSCIV
jgi:hypothetical protein